MELIKFTDEEMAELKQLQDAYNTIIISFGQSSLELLNIEKMKSIAVDKKEKLETDYDLILQKERDLAEKLSVKYGEGILDPQTGVFTPKVESPKTE